MPFFSSQSFSNYFCELFLLNISKFRQLVVHTKVAWELSISPTYELLLILKQEWFNLGLRPCLPFMLQRGSQNLRGLSRYSIILVQSNETDIVIDTDLKYVTMIK